MFTKKELEAILSQVDLTWFTHCVKGTLKRYVVGLTNNTERSVDVLMGQIMYYGSMNENLTIGWRLDDRTNQVYIDVGVCTDDLSEAILLCYEFHQKCLWDVQNKCEIRASYPKRAV